MTRDHAPVWIKICANTCLEDVLLAESLGANALGFVFAPSARRVTPDQVAAMVAQLPESIEKIGVFSSQTALEIAEIARQAGLTGIQLHGVNDVSLARELNAEFRGLMSITQTLHWKLGEDTDNAEQVASQLRTLAGEPAVHRILLDSQTKHASGGTGLSFDWKAAAAVLNRDQTRVEAKLIAAGGLADHNVIEAIRILRPWGVDVASGVEISPGHKDAAKLARFIKAVREV